MTETTDTRTMTWAALMALVAELKSAHPDKAVVTSRSTPLLYTICIADPFTRVIEQRIAIDLS